jgi:hypothetical protein
LVLVVHYRSVWYMYVLLSELDKMFVTRTAFVSVTSSYKVRNDYVGWLFSVIQVVLTWLRVSVARFISILLSHYE